MTNYKNLFTQSETVLTGITCKYGDAASGGLLYLLCTSEDKPLMQACFCKDYFQDFAFGHSTNITDKGSVYGYDIKNHYVNETFIKDNPTLVFYLYSGSKGSMGESKKSLVDTILNSSESLNKLTNQLDILESVFLNLNLITKKSEITPLTISVNGNQINSIKIEFSSEYLQLPEVLSLFTLLLRNFLTFDIFKSYDTAIKDLEDFLSTSKKIPVNQYIYGSDVTIFSSDQVILKLPLILKGSIKLSLNWDRYLKDTIYNIHNNSGIYSFITTQNN